MLDFKVRDADVADQAFFDELLHGQPGLLERHSLDLVGRGRLGNVGAEGDREVNQIEVEVRDLELLEGLEDAFLDQVSAVEIIPKLAASRTKDDMAGWGSTTGRMALTNLVIQTSSRFTTPALILSLSARPTSPSF